MHEKKNEHRSFYRLFHRSSIHLEQELTAKERKKLLKEKAKAAMAEKAKAAEEESVDPLDTSKSEPPLDAESDGDDSSSSGSSSGGSSSSSGDTPPKGDEASSNDPNPEASYPSAEQVPTSEEGAPKQYSYPELTADAAKHKAGMDDPTRPEWQNPLHHYNPDERVFEEDFSSKEEFEEAVLPAPPVADADGNVPPPEHIQQLADEMVNLTMLEYNELINKVAEHYGFSEADLAPDDDQNADGDDDGDDDAPVAEAKTKFDVKLVSFDSGAKIKIIKEIRTIVAGLGLKEAKALVESAPVTLQKDMSQEAVDEVKAKLEALGAVIEIE